MKIYFASSYVSAVDNNKVLEQIIASLKSSGHSVIKRPFKPDDDKETLEANVGKVLDLTDEDISTTYKNMLKRIRESDIVVAEVTSTSNSIGYEIATAQNEKKPVLCIFDKNQTKRLANFFKGNDSRTFKVIGYSDAQDANDGILKFIEEAKSLMDTKFILIISPEIDKYMEWVAAEKRMHKAQVVRNAIEASMNKDKEYKDFIKSIE